MKKILIITVVVVAVMAFGAAVASANGGPHGGYTATTDACAGCHRTHTAPAAQLLIDTDPNLCLTCHGAGGVGANTNVEGGIFDNSFAPSNGLGTLNAPLKGGGFTQWRAQNQAAFVAITSRHNKTAAFGPTNATGAWGNGSNRGVVGAAIAGGFRCSACHDPHGSTNWRIMKTTVNGVAVTVRANNNGADEATKSYTADATDNQGPGISAFCAACHAAYHQTADNQGSTVNNGTYTHRIDMAFNDAPYAANVNPETPGWVHTGGDCNPNVAGNQTCSLPLADYTGTNGAGTTVTCLTCHLSHGTSANMTNWAAGTYDPLGPVGPVPSGDSALLRLDNRGTCEVCHQK